VEYLGEDLHRFVFITRIFIEDETGNPASYEILETRSPTSSSHPSIKGDREELNRTQPLIGKTFFVGERSPSRIRRWRILAGQTCWG